MDEMTMTERSSRVNGGGKGERCRCGTHGRRIVVLGRVCSMVLMVGVAGRAHARA